MPIHMWVSGEDVQIGDELLEYRGYASGNVASDRNVVKRKVLDGRAKDCFMGTDGTLYYGGVALEWYVKRKFDNVSSCRGCRDYHRRRVHGSTGA